MKVGDKCRHRSGGPMMIVNRLIGDQPQEWEAAGEVECQWMTQGALRVATFKPELLEPVPDQPAA